MIFVRARATTTIMRTTAVIFDECCRWKISHFRFLLLSFSLLYRRSAFEIADVAVITFTIIVITIIYICIIIIILCNAFEMSFTRDIAAERNALKKKNTLPLCICVCCIYICISIFIDDSKAPEICRCILYTLRRC